MSLDFKTAPQPMFSNNETNWTKLIIGSLVSLGLLTLIYYLAAQPTTPRNDYNQTYVLDGLNNLRTCIQKPFLRDSKFGIYSTSESLQECYRELFNFSATVIENSAYWIRSSFLNTFLYIFMDFSEQIQLMQNTTQNLTSITNDLKQINPSFDDSNMQKLNTAINELYALINPITETLIAKRIEQ